MSVFYCCEGEHKEEAAIAVRKAEKQCQEGAARLFAVAANACCARGRIYGACGGHSIDYGLIVNVLMWLFCCRCKCASGQCVVSGTT